MTRTFVALVAALILVVGACGGSGGDEVASLVGGTDTGSDTGTDGSQTDQHTDEEDALLAFAQCMRDNGVEGFEDPVVDADGSVQFGFRGRGTDGEDPFGGVDRETARNAMQTCQQDLDGIALGPGGSDFDVEEFQDTFVEFAACMRDNGVQMDDPDFSNFGPGQGREQGEGGGPFADIDLDDPDVRSALEACQSIFGDQNVPFFGGGPGDNGGQPRGGGDGAPPGGGGNDA